MVSLIRTSVRTRGPVQSKERFCKLRFPDANPPYVVLIIVFLRVAAGDRKGPE